MQSNGYEPNAVIIVGGFLGCEIIGLILLLSNFKHIMVYELEELIVKHNSAPFTVLTNASQENVHKKFLDRKFLQTNHGYLSKKTFVFLKDSIEYYAKTVECQNIGTALDEEFEKLDSLCKNNKNVCCFLFVYKNNLTDEDFDILRNYSIERIVDEKATIPPAQYYHSAILILVDQSNDRGYFLDIQKKRDISIYAYGCRLIKKLYKTS